MRNWILLDIFNQIVFFFSIFFINWKCFLFVSFLYRYSFWLSMSTQIKTVSCRRWSLFSSSLSFWDDYWLNKWNKRKVTQCRKHLVQTTNKKNSWKVVGWAESERKSSLSRRERRDLHSFIYLQLIFIFFFFFFLLLLPHFDFFFDVHSYCFHFMLQ